MPATVSREVTAREILKGLHPLDLRNLAKNREITTKFMSAGYVHRLRARVADTQRVSADGQWSAADGATIDRVYRFLGSQRLVQVDLQVCASPPAYHVRLYVPLIHAELGFMASRAMVAAPAEWAARPQAGITAIVLPEWSDERSVLVDMGRSVTFVLGSDYYGDIHNSVLRLVGQRARQHGHMALHAGSVEILARSRKTNDLNRCGVLLLGAGGAGKTTLAACDYGLDGGVGEKASIRQDDRVILHPDGAVQGTEGQGLYVRTLGLCPRERPALFAACTHEDAVLENVWVNADASVDFASDALTTNGRAIVPIGRIAGSDGQVDLARCTHLVFLARQERLPAVARLEAELAVRTFFEGEPAEADLLVELLRGIAGVQCFVLNTGKTGPARAAGILREICRDSLEWARSESHAFEEPIGLP